MAGKANAQSLSAIERSRRLGCRQVLGRLAGMDEDDADDPLDTDDEEDD